jgi:ABC-type transporter Mla subunit MlaD
MIARPSFEKLGILVLLAVSAVVVFGFLLGVRTGATDAFHTFFDETVQGLESGAYVKYRGVRIGTVRDITVAPDGRHIDVVLELQRDKVQKFEIHKHAGDLRARLAIIGITGLKLIDLEPKNERTPPPPKLSFPTPPNYIPARQSLVADLEGIFDRVGDKLPRAIDRAIATLEIIEKLSVDARHAELPARIATAADQVAQAATHLKATITRFDRGAGSASTKLLAILENIASPDGLLASVRNTTESFGDISRTAVTSAVDLERTMRELRDAARAMRGFFDDLERQPDMILKGRSKSRSR